MKLIIRLVLWVLSIAVTLLLILTIIFMFQKDDGKSPTVAGYTAFVGTGHSMEPEIDPGTLLIIKECEEYEIDDIISFENDEEKNVTHRIVDRYGSKYITKGDNNKRADGYKVRKSDVYGKVVFKIPKVGEYISFVNKNKNNIYYILGGLVVIGILFKFGAKHVR